MNITVIGCGRWGTFLAYYLDLIGHKVTLYGRSSSQHYQELRDTRTNGLVTLSPSLRLSDTLSSLDESDVVVISVGSQALRKLCNEEPLKEMKGKQVVLCMKGLEIGSGKRLSEVCAETLSPTNTVSVWLGPGHVQDFVKKVPNCMVIDSASEKAKKVLIDAFSGPLIRFYYGKDLIGNEIGAASKNVIGIAAGMLDGMGLSSLKGALMSRGTNEIARLIDAMGGDSRSAYGLCHLGDYEATVFSSHSHNRQYGESVVLGRPYTFLAEGYYTVKALMELRERYRVELPICEAVYAVLYLNKDPRQTMDALFRRSLKTEFYQ